MQVNEDTRKMLNSATKKAVKALVVIVLIISILYFFFVLKLGIDSIRDLQRFTSTFSVIMISLLKIVAVLLVFALLLMLGLWLFRKEDGVEILPFIVAKGEEDRYSGEAISDLLAAEFERIRRIHNTKYEGISPIDSERLNLRLLSPESEKLTNIAGLGPINAGTVSGLDLKSLPKMVTGFGTNTISIGEVLIILKQLCPGRYSKNFISGSLQKYDSSIILVARFQSRDNTFAWEVDHKQDGQNQNDEGKIPSLIRDLSFKIICDLLHLSDFVADDTWLGFKYFTESLNEFQQYKLTGDATHLELSRENCLLAANIERGYDKIYALLYNLGIAYLNERHYDEAKNLLLKVVEHKPDDYAFVDLDWMHGPLGEIGPDKAELWFNKGNAFYNLGRMNEALKAYEKAIEIDPQNVDAWYNKGMVLHNLGSNEEALKACEKAIELNPQNAEAWNNKGGALIDLGRNEEALNACKKAIDIDPRLAMAWANKGGALSILGQAEEGLEACEMAIDLDPELSIIWNNKGIILAILGRDEESIKAYEKAIEIDPQNANVWHNKGMALDKLGQTEGAMEAYEKAIEIEPKKAVTHVALARLYRKLGRESDSFDACKTARDLIESENEYNRACFEAVCGSPDAALDLLRNALKNKEQTADYARRDPDLEFIRDDLRFTDLLDEFSEDGEKGPK